MDCCRKVCCPEGHIRGTSLQLNIYNWTERKKKKKKKRNKRQNNSNPSPPFMTRSVMLCLKSSTLALHLNNNQSPFQGRDTMKKKMTIYYFDSMSSSFPCKSPPPQKKNTPEHFCSNHGIKTLYGQQHQLQRASML